MIYMGILLFIGLIILVLGFRSGESSMTGFAVGLIAISILKMLQYLRIMKNPAMLHKFEINENEERLIFIVTHSAHAALCATELLGAISIIILIALGKETEATIVTMAICGMLLIYLGFYWYYSKKY